MSDVMGRYRLEERLGQGGMAEVFRARHAPAEGISKQVVVKRILPTFAGRADFRAMFFTEARLTIGMSHGNLVQVFDAGELDGQLFIAMEWVDGVGLDQVLRRARERGARLPPVVSVLIAIEALKGLHHAHTRVGEGGRALQIVHRDVSPDNLLVSYEGQVKVTDFGVAKAALEGRAETQAGVFKGKLAYGAPEQIRAESVDARADVYSLGVVLHEMLSGANPIGASALELALKGLPLPRVGTHFVGEELPEIIARATAPRPAERYPSALALQQALAGWVAGPAGTHASTAIANVMAWLFPAELKARGLPAELDPETLRWLEAESGVGAGAPAAAAPTEGDGHGPTLMKTPADAQMGLEPTLPASVATAARRTPWLAVGAAALLVLGTGAWAVTRWGGRSDTGALKEAQEAFARRDLTTARAALQQQLLDGDPSHDALRLMAEIDEETLPAAALNDAERTVDQAATAHQPLDRPKWSTLLEQSRRTIHFQRDLAALQARVEATWSTPRQTVLEALAAADANDLAKVRKLLACPIKACSDGWYAEQLELERTANAALDEADALIEHDDVPGALAKLPAAGKTLFQAQRYAQLEGRLGGAALEASVVAQMKRAIAAGDVAAADRALDACRGAAGCPDLPVLEAQFEEEKGFAHDLDLAERAITQRKFDRAWAYVDSSGRTHALTERYARVRAQLSDLSPGPRKKPDPDPIELVRAEQVKNWKEAVRLLNRRAAADPDDFECQLRLGDAYAGRGFYAEARAAFERFLELAPSRDPRREGLRQRIDDLTRGPKPSAGAPPRDLEIDVKNAVKSVRAKAQP